MNLHLWRPFITVSLALCIGTIGTALASPLYPLYQAVWHLLPSDITYIFVAYMFGCMTTLLFLGRTSNSLGYIRTLQIGLFIAILGLIFSVFAHQAMVLGIGRFIIGIASGLISTSAMLGLMCTIPASHQQNAAQISSIVTVIGFGLGPLVGGSIAEFSEYPLVTPYVPIIVLACLSLISLFTLRAPAITKQPFSIAPRLDTPEKQYKAIFYIGGFTAFCAFAAFCLFASLAPSFIQDILPWHGPLVSGITISGILMFSALAQIYSRRFNMHQSINQGLIAMIVSLVLLALCMAFELSFLFFTSVILVGWGHGAGLIGAFEVMQRITTTNNRAAVISTYLFIAYLGTILPIVSVGYISDHFGFTTSIISFCIVIAALCFYLWRKHTTVKAELEQTFIKENAG